MILKALSTEESERGRVSANSWAGSKAGSTELMVQGERAPAGQRMPEWGRPLQRHQGGCARDRRYRKQESLQGWVNTGTEALERLRGGL